MGGGEEAEAGLTTAGAGSVAGTVADGFGGGSARAITSSLARRADDDALLLALDDGSTGFLSSVSASGGVAGNDNAGILAGIEQRKNKQSDTRDCHGGSRIQKPPPSILAAALSAHSDAAPLLVPRFRSRLDPRRGLWQHWRRATTTRGEVEILVWRCRRAARYP